jgi:predicted RNase H-like nuclease (RuvC/YqgF family)
MSDLSFSTKEYRDCFENDAEALAHALRQANRLEQKVRELEAENDELKYKLYKYKRKAKDAEGYIMSFNEWKEDI